MALPNVLALPWEAGDKEGEGQPGTEPLCLRCLLWRVDRRRLPRTDISVTKLKCATMETKCH